MCEIGLLGVFPVPSLNPGWVTQPQTNLQGIWSPVMCAISTITILVVWSVVRLPSPFPVMSVSAARGLPQYHVFRAGNKTVNGLRRVSHRLYVTLESLRYCCQGDNYLGNIWYEYFGFAYPDHVVFYSKFRWKILTDNLLQNSSHVSPS